MAAFVLMTVGCAPLPALANNLTPGSQTVTGSAVGQIAAAQPASSNCIPGTSNYPAVTQWTIGGSATRTIPFVPWDGGFMPMLMSGTGTADTLTQSAISLTVTPGCLRNSTTPTFVFSGQFTTSPVMLSASPPSTQVSLKVVYRDSLSAIIRTDTIVFSPITGQLISASSGISSVNMQLFTSTVRDLGTGINSNIPVLGVSFNSSTVSLPVTADIIITPNNLTSATRFLLGGGFQLEQSNTNSAFIPTPQSGVTTTTFRRTGAIPYQDSYTARTPIPLTAGGSFDPQTMNGRTLVVGAAQTLAMGGTYPANILSDGDSVTLQADSTGGSFTVSRGTDPTSVFCGGGLTTGVTSFTYPSSAFPFAAITLVWGAYNCGAVGTGGWSVVSSSTASGGGSGCATSGTSGQVLTDNGAGGCLSKSNVTINSTTLSTIGAAGTANMLQVGTGSTTQQGWILGNRGSGVSGIWGSNVTPGTNNFSFLIDNTNNTYINAQSAGIITNRVNNTPVFDISSAGGAVTGTLSVSGNLTAANLTPAGTLTNARACLYNSGGPQIDCNTVTTNANTASAIVQRDGSGNFSAGVIALTGGNATVTIGSGTAALGTSAISSGACATTVTAAVTGAATTDNLSADFNSDPTAVTGYGVSASGLVLTVYKWLTSGQVNIKVCNSTGSSITPSAATLQYRVVR